ncbi:MAG: TonB-dependent receptor [Gammaproteobacteria bacterium]|nr:TonB-dependent receptor [Gammaproteobacteria bacterium]
MRRNSYFTSSVGLAIVAVINGGAAQAAGIPTLEAVNVESSFEDLVGTANSANEGTVTKEQLDARTTYRPGELLETTPGLIVTQHSGEGKAGQYYLRGFNLDHGTDLRTTVDGMLVNERTHAHGQGWTDLNFIIPELASNLQYKKGPYYADEGDFSSAGAVAVSYVDSFPQAMVGISAGQNGYRRALFADSPSVANGKLLYAFEYQHNDGPFTNPDDYNKYNGVLRFSRGAEADKLSVAFMAYSGKWNATDQIPKSAVDAGLLSRWDAIDTSDGGDAQRMSVSVNRQKLDDNGATEWNAYVIKQSLDLYSNFTYFLDDPVNGDQFNQRDSRYTVAANWRYTWFGNIGSKSTENTVGLQLQNDWIENGLHKTKTRSRLSTVRSDEITETSLGAYVQNSTHWLEKFRTVLGVRGDVYQFDVASNNPLNSGKTDDFLVNPKMAMIFGPWAKTEFYLNAGGGFHSNDARGTTITVDPVTSAAAEKVTPLVQSWGYEAGVRSGIIPKLQSTLNVYTLTMDSELLFVGDAGTTEAGRPSRRVGAEFANYYAPTSWLTIDADLAYAFARFTDNDPAGNRIPGAVEGVGSLGVTVDRLGPWYGGANLRYFGPRALVEDNSQRSQSTTLLSAQLGYHVSKTFDVTAEVFNLLDTQASAIDYYYESKMSPSASAAADKHFHPIESRSVRLLANLRF